jgi:subtilisin family serine protease
MTLRQEWLVKRLMPTLIAAALMCGVILAVGETAAPANDNGRTHAVTLVTGDRVLLGPAAGMHVTPVAGKGRKGMPFSIQRQGNHLYVIPADAAQLVSAGRLDRRLFDVVYLDKEGYDSSEDVPLIVQGESGIRSLAGTRNFRALPVIKGAAVRVEAGGSFWRAVAGHGTPSSGVHKIWLDAKVHMSLDRSVPQIGGPDAWKAGYTGTGVKVAVLDSGVDATHPDLAGRIALQKNFTDEPDTDLIGHGTHVAATVASNDSVYRGVAPSASLLIGKVIGQNGSGDWSALLAAMEWASTEQHAKVVNMSLGGPDTPEIDPLEEAVNRLSAQNGTLFVTGAGNDGYGGDQTVASPSTADAAVSVGAVDRDDTIAPFSSRGPRIGDYAIKPDITAPGVGIVAARSKDGYLGDPGDTHMPGTGTSMSCPHVAGAAALLFQEHPDWTPAQVKAALMASAKPTAGASAYDQGAGRVNLTQAITQRVLAEQPSASFGIARWPHADDQPITRKLTYRNTRNTDVTLDLSVQATGPDGKPAATFTLSASSLTVPAGGTASIVVTADTRGDHPDGNYTGQVVATATDTTVRTPLAVVREVESYDLTVTPLDRDGNLTTNSTTQLGSYDPLVKYEQTVDPDGTVHYRAPRGHYVLSAEILSGQDGAGTTDQVTAPWLDLSADQAITVDARTTKPVTVTVERTSASFVSGVIGYDTVAPDGGVSGGWTDITDISKVGTAQIGPDAPAGRFAGALQATFAAAGADGTFANSPYVYNLSWFTANKAYTGSRRVRDAELATVQTENLPQGDGDFALKGSLATSTQLPGATFPGLELLPLRLPSTREELFTTAAVEWTTLFFQGDPTAVPDRSDATQQALLRTYQPGRRYVERWNGAVFGPSLPGREDQAWANQIPDRGLAFQVPLFGMAADTAGQSKLDSAHTVVLRDGTTVCTSDSTACTISGNQPQGRYRVETQATRSFTDTSTRVSVVWEVDNDGTPALPVQVVRFSPTLDAANTAPGGQAFAVPVSVQRNPGAKAARLAALSVQVSYDDGAHWQNAPMADGKALLHHPAGGYVSLRAKATDTAGNTVQQTIIHAYRLR